MRKEVVTCENIFTGEEETKELYFHLTEAELVTLNLISGNKYAQFNKDKEHTAVSDIELFEQLISKAYGQKTEDGQFIKDETAKKAFLCSPAYSALLMKFANNEISVKDFVMDCLPKGISSKIVISDDGNVSLKK